MWENFSGRFDRNLRWNFPEKWSDERWKLFNQGWWKFALRFVIFVEKLTHSLWEQVSALTSWLNVRQEGLFFSFLTISPYVLTREPFTEKVTHKYISVPNDACSPDYQRNRLFENKITQKPREQTQNLLQIKEWNLLKWSNRSVRWFAVIYIIYKFWDTLSSHALWNMQNMKEKHKNKFKFAFLFKRNNFMWTDDVWHWHNGNRIIKMQSRGQAKTIFRFTLVEGLILI